MRLQKYHGRIMVWRWRRCRRPSVDNDLRAILFLLIGLF
jgi:hypothetical protein